MEMIKLIFKGADDTDLSVALLVDGNWTQKKIKDRPGYISPQSSHNPGVALFHNWTYIVYKGVSDNDLWMAWFDGDQWNGNVKISTMPGGIDPKSNESPKLVVFQNQLYMIYKNGNSNRLFWASFDGGTWYGNAPIDIDPQRGDINPQSDSTPGVAVYQEKLYLVYKGWDNHLLYLSWFDGTNWFGNRPIDINPQRGFISPQSNLSPNLCVYNDKLYMVYKAWNDYVLYSSWFDGTNWYGNASLNPALDPRSDKTPGIIVFDYHLYIFYKAWNSTTLFSAWFDGTTWKGNTPISSQGGAIDARSNGNPNPTYAPRPLADRSDWMKDLDDDMLISEISIPGTHDSAAINKHVHTPYATQHLSISGQLKAGIRVLDIRIKVKPAIRDRFTFVTCHGSIGSSLGLNEYQPFNTVLNECKSFLKNNPSEVIIMSLKVDDWTSVAEGMQREKAKRDLGYLLNSNGYPVIMQRDLPTLGSVRGKIFLFNRIYDGIFLGTPVSWQNNTTGDLAFPNPFNHRTFDVFVQDKYRELSDPAEEEKLRLVKDAFGKYQHGQVLLNFASATKGIEGYEMSGVYINKQLLAYFGQTPLARRPTHLGWVMFDYPEDKFYTDMVGDVSIIPLIISANMGYRNFAGIFMVIH